MEQNNLKKTTLYKKHVELGAKMCEFSGFLMPLYYSSSVNEHLSVRKNAGIFDVSHMGKLVLKGKQSKKLIQYLTTNDISTIKTGQAQYTCLINKNGGIIDDLVIYKINEEEFLLIVNAINIEKNKIWINDHIKKYQKIDLIDFSQEYSLLSIQGPLSFYYLKNITKIHLHKISYYHFTIGEMFGIKNVLISRTGYTGSLIGIEIYIPNKNVEKLWNNILEIGNEKIIPCGISSRNTLRLEMGYRLYGKEISETISPIESGLSWIVKFNKEFIAKNILKKQKINRNHKKFISFYIKEGRIIPREGYLLINNEGNEIGYVTSGGYSPILKKGIGLGYMLQDIQTNHIFLEIRKKKLPVIKKKLPFIKI
ncbi:glycine cleavage system aminomethyltransferase GcvT [Blattabacterium cuenoti]|uniref:glycine cleavage system aminomethyltransferase GcvT n=1 Tax=Blattabacterium cuenoti TaxID=1653831 RepID=UPI00163BE8FC|nr:glycine cleavage system aminomethyltransferase GcvT [Blattabacterium cuenoti]